MDALSRFAALVGRSEREVDLVEAALLIAAAGDPGMEPAPWLAEIARYAVGVTDLDGLLHRCFRDLGFRGDTQHYYDPDNSFLHRVMTRRVGIPITLSLITIAVGQQAGVPLEAVGMPGHFLVGVPGRRTYVDAFDAGRLLDVAGCEARFRAAAGAGSEVAFGFHLLPVVGPHAVLTRMLANLSVTYELRHSGTDLEWVARMRLALPEAATAEVLALASALERQGRFLDAAREIEAWEGAGRDPSGQLTHAARRLRARFN